jgi:hypothetical protein
MCRNCKYIAKDSFYNDIVYEGTTSERVEVAGYCIEYDVMVWVDVDECTNYEEGEDNDER